MTETPDYKRTTIALAQPGQDEHTIGVTLWGEQAVAEITSGVTVAVSAVVKEDIVLFSSQFDNFDCQICFSFSN